MQWIIYTFLMIQSSITYANTFDCTTAGPGTCKNMTLTCDPGEDCTVNCEGANENDTSVIGFCMDATINAAANNILTVNCNIQNGAGDVSSSCKDAVINTNGASVVNILCENTQEGGLPCQGLTITGSATTLNMDCIGKRACYGAIIGVSAAVNIDCRDGWQACARVPINGQSGSDINVICTTNVGTSTCRGMNIDASSSNSLSITVDANSISDAGTLVEAIIKCPSTGNAADCSINVNNPSTSVLCVAEFEAIGGVLDLNCNGPCFEYFDTYDCEGPPVMTNTATNTECNFTNIDATWNSFQCDTCTIWEYPGCEPAADCLIDGKQINGELYIESGTCYKALTDCNGCLADPDNHNDKLQPVDCDCSEAPDKTVYSGCSIYEWPFCGPGCLDGAAQQMGEIYRVGSECYRAITGCAGCLGNPNNHPAALAPINCDCSTYASPTTAPTPYPIGLVTSVLLQLRLDGDLNALLMYLTENNVDVEAFVVGTIQNLIDHAPDDIFIWYINLYAGSIVLEAGLSSAKAGLLEDALADIYAAVGSTIDYTIGDVEFSFPFLSVEQMEEMANDVGSFSSSDSSSDSSSEEIEVQSARYDNSKNSLYPHESNTNSVNEMVIIDINTWNIVGFVIILQMSVFCCYYGKQKLYQRS